MMMISSLIKKTSFLHSKKKTWKVDQTVHGPDDQCRDLTIQARNDVVAARRVKKSSSAGTTIQNPLHLWLGSLLYIRNPFAAGVRLPCLVPTPYNCTDIVQNNVGPVSLHKITGELLDVAAQLTTARPSALILTRPEE